MGQDKVSHAKFANIVNIFLKMIMQIKNTCALYKESLELVSYHHLNVLCIKMIRNIYLLLKVMQLIITIKNMVELNIYFVLL